MPDHDIQSAQEITVYPWVNFMHMICLHLRSLEYSILQVILKQYNHLKIKIYLLCT